MTDKFRCAKAQVYHNTKRLTPAQIRRATGCSHIVNGYLFNSRWQPIGWTVVDGTVISRDAYRDWGISIGADGRPVMSTDRERAFLSAVPLLKDGKALARDLTPDVARPAARTAMGWTADGRVLLWCDRRRLTRDGLRRELAARGAVDALMLDGGGSTQGIFPGGKVVSSRKVPTLLLFWAEK